MICFLLEIKVLICDFVIIKLYIFFILVGIVVDVMNEVVEMRKLKKDSKVVDEKESLRKLKGCWERFCNFFKILKDEEYFDGKYDLFLVDY